MKYVLNLLPIVVFLAMQLACTQETPKEAPSPSELTRVSYMSKATGEERDYFVYLPEGYKSDTTKKWPVMLFLHGNGERGNGKDELDYVIIHGPLYEAWIQKRDLPFIIVAPQLPMYGMDSIADYIRNRKKEDIPVRMEQGEPERPEEFPTPQPMTGAVENIELPTPSEGPRVGWFMLEDDLLSIIDRIKEEYSVDPGRFYLSGISYGGFGTWYFASKHPEIFAAIVPVVGYGHPDLMEPIAKAQLPVWCFAGGRDFAVQLQYFYSGLNKLESLGHKELLFTIHADMNHDTWRRVYAGEDVYNWMLAHEK